MFNYWAILVVSIIGYIIPMIWYSSALFGKEWLRLSKLKSMKPSGGVILVGFITTLIFNAVLALIVAYTGVDTFSQGMAVAFLVWIGFIATTLMGSVLYNKSPVALYLINVTQYLISMLIAGGILAVWR